jgi:hypothetical protein
MYLYKYIEPIWKIIQKLTKHSFQCVLHHYFHGIKSGLLQMFSHLISHQFTLLHKNWDETFQNFQIESWVQYFSMPPPNWYFKKKIKQKLKQHVSSKQIFGQFYICYQPVPWENQIFRIPLLVCGASLLNLIHAG